MADMFVAARIQAPDGWHELEDEPNGRWLEENSFSQRAYARRDSMLDGDWVDGSWALRSTKGNVTEMVNVWVDGDGSNALFTARMETTKSWFDQLAFTMQVTVGDLQETWSCPKPADYTEVTNKPYRFATRGLLQVQVQRLPAITYVTV